MKSKKIALFLIILSIIPIFSMMTQNVECAGAVESIEINGIDSPYHYDTSNDIFNVRIYYDTYYGQYIKYKWSDEGSYRLWSEYGSDPRVTTIGQASGSDEYGTYRDWDFHINLTRFNPGSYEFQTGVIDIDTTIYYTNATFIRESEPVDRNPPVITINSPYDLQYINISIGSISTSVTITDNTPGLSSVKVYWDGVVNQTWSSPAQGIRTHSIPISDGVTLNGTHTITWEATDSDGIISNETVRVIIYDMSIVIDMKTDLSSWQNDNDFPLKFGFSDANGLDDARMYIPGCEFDGTNQIITVNNAEVFYSYLQNISIDDEHYVHSITITYSDIMKWFYGFDVDDSGDDYSGDKTAYYTIAGTDFLRRKTFNITNPKAEALTNFPVRIPITYDSDMQTDFDDVTFTDSTGTVYDYELTSIVDSTSAQAWIRIPTFSSSATITITMYYGNPTSTSKEDSSGTFSDFHQVYHFDEVSGTTAYDSANGEDLTAYNSLDMVQDGMVGDCARLDGSDDYFGRTDTVTGGSDDTRTWFWWLEPHLTPDYGTVWSECKSGDTGTGYNYIVNYVTSTYQGWYFNSNGGGTDTYQASPLYGTGWRFHTITKNNNDLEYFYDGNAIAVDSNGVIGGDTTNDLFVGKRYDSNANFFVDGDMDELMIYDGVPTDNWIYSFYYYQAGDRATWFSEENNTNYWFYSSKGWQWDDSTSDSGDYDGLRTDGLLNIWHNDAGDVMEINANSTQLTADGSEYIIEANMTALNTTSLYDGWGIATKVTSSWYAKIYYKPWLTDLCYGVSDSSRANMGNWQHADYSVDDYTWNQNEWHTLKIWVSVGNWIAFYLDDVQQANYTALGQLTTENFTKAYISVNNAMHNSSSVLAIDYFKSGWDGWVISNLSETNLINSLNVTLPLTWGDDLQINHTATLRTRFDVLITIEVNSTYYSIFENDATTTRIETWYISDYHWENNISEGVFYINIYLSNDLGTIYWFNMTMHKDTTAPSFHFRLIPETTAENVFLADYPPYIDFTYLEWGANDGYQNSITVMIEPDSISGKTWVWDDVRYSSPADFPDSVSNPVSVVCGTFTVLVRIFDTAHNEANQTIHFTIVRRKAITFSLVASNGKDIPSFITDYWGIEINGFRIVGLIGSTLFDTFTLGIYDAFGQTLHYDASVTYSENIQVILSRVYLVAFANLEPVPVEITVAKTSGAVSFILAGNSDVNYYLRDGTYKVIANPNGAMRTRHSQFVTTDFNLAVTTSLTNSLQITLDFIEVDGIQGFSLSSITDILNMAIGIGLVTTVISAIVIVRRLRPPLLKIEDTLIEEEEPVVGKRRENNWTQKGESSFSKSNGSTKKTKGFKKKK